MVHDLPFPLKRNLFSHTFRDIGLSNIQGVADQKSSNHGTKKQREVNLDENFLPRARDQTQAHVNGSHPLIIAIFLTYSQSPKHTHHFHTFQQRNISWLLIYHMEDRKGNK